jgi:hypothetical protein
LERVGKKYLPILPFFTCSTKEKSKMCALIYSPLSRKCERKTTTLCYDLFSLTSDKIRKPSVLLHNGNAIKIIPYFKYTDGFEKNISFSFYKIKVRNTKF